MRLPPTHRDAGRPRRVRQDGGSAEADREARALEYQNAVSELAAGRRRAERAEADVLSARVELRAAQDHAEAERVEAERRAEGIPVPGRTWHGFEKIAEKLGVVGTLGVDAETAADAAEALSSLASLDALADHFEDEYLVALRAAKKV